MIEREEFVTFAGKMSEKLYRNSKMGCVPDLMSRIRLFAEFEPVDTVVFAFKNQFFNTRFGYGKTIAELTRILSERMNVEIHVTGEDKAYLDKEMENAGVSESAYARIETCPSECILNSFMPIFGHGTAGEVVGITFPFLPNEEDYATNFRSCEEYAERFLFDRRIEKIRLPFEFGATRIVANEKIALISNFHENSEAKKWFETNVTQQCFFVPYLGTEPTKDLDVFVLPMKDNKWILSEFAKGSKEKRIIDSVSQLLIAQKQEVIFVPGLERVKHDDVDCLPNYTNCLIANDMAIVPEYNRREDRAIGEVLSGLGYEVHSVEANRIAESNAVFHCISKTIPKPQSGTEDICPAREGRSL